MDPIQSDQLRFWSGLAPSPVDLRMTGAQLLGVDRRDHALARVPEVASILSVGAPPSGDLGDHILGTYNQGTTPSCVAHSTAGMKSIQDQIEHAEWIEFDALELYRANGGNGTNGVPTRDVLDYAQKTGLLAAARQRRYRIGSYAFAPFEPSQWVETIKAAITAERPCVLAFLIPASFGWESDGVPTQAYHQVVVYGYDATWAYILNSWGPGFGQNGRGRLRWDYLVGNDFQRKFNYAYAVVDGMDVVDGGGGGGGGGGGTVDGFGAGLLNAVNQARAQSGVPALAAHPALVQAAQGHADDMVRRNYYSHTSPEGETALGRMVKAGLTDSNIAWAENIAAGQADVASVMNAWMNSPGHRQNILGQFTHFGGGYAQGGTWGRMWCQTFARLQGGPPPPPPPIGHSVSGIRGGNTVMVGQQFQVEGTGFTSNAVEVQIAGQSCGGQRLSPTLIQATAPSVAVSGTLRVRVDGGWADGPAVTVQGGGPPPPPPPPSDLRIVLASRPLWRGKYGLWCYIYDGQNRLVTNNTVTATIGGRILSGRSGGGIYTWVEPGVAGETFAVRVEANGKSGVAQKII